MTKTALPRTGLSQWSSDTDAWPARAGWNAENTATESKTAVYSQGIMSARPAAAAAQVGRFFWATDTQRLWYDSGGTWTEVSPVGGGGTPAAETVNVAGAEGSSRIAARADHVHALAAPGADPAASTYGGTADRGVSATVARADHRHALAALPLAVAIPGAITVGGAGAIGSNTNLAKQDHSHPLAVPDLDPGRTVPGATANRGTSVTVARADHAHPMDALPYATAGTPPVPIDIGDAAAVGVSTALARADHQHALVVPGADPAPVVFGQAMSRGSAATVARADHTHAIDLDAYDAVPTPYTPVFSSASGGSFTGINRLLGFYRLHGKFCDVWVYAMFGTTGVFSAGQGTITVSLPFASLPAMSSLLPCSMYMGPPGVNNSSGEVLHGDAYVDTYIGANLARPHFPYNPYVGDYRLLAWSSTSTGGPGTGTPHYYLWGAPPDGSFVMTGQYLIA